MYKPQFYSSFKKVYKKNAQPLKTEIDTIILRLCQDPTLGETLTGNWQGFRSFHFGRKPEYRLFYRFYDCRANAQNTEQTKALCRFNLCETNEEIANCVGVLDFVTLATREEATQIYRLDKKEVDGYRRE